MTSRSDQAEARETRFNELLRAACEDFHYSIAHTRPGATCDALVDEEGHKLFDIPEHIAKLLDGVNGAEVVAFLQFAHGLYSETRDKCYEIGKETGRVQYVATLHDLLGIDRIVEALAQRGPS